MIKTQMFIAGALLAGVAIGYFAGGHGDVAKPADVQEGSAVRKAAVADAGEAASLKALRHRIAELEKLLAEKAASGELTISNAVAEAVKAAQAERPRHNPREWMENLKKTDPARYTQMTNRFAQWRARRAVQAQNKIDFLSSIDTSHMSAGARKTHDALQDLIAKREEIEQQLQQEGLSDAERDRLMKEMWSTHHEMQRLNGEERRNLIDETARNLGFSGDDAKEFTATIQDVIEATDGGFGGHHRGGPPPGGPQGGAGGPPGGPGGR